MLPAVVGLGIFAICISFVPNASSIGGTAEVSSSGAADCPCRPPAVGNESLFGHGSCHDWGNLQGCQDGDSSGELKYCTGVWCYVDASECSRPWHQSELQPGAAFSWATCGYVPSSASAYVVSGLRNQTIKLAYPEDGPYMYLRTRQDGSKFGVLPAILDTLVDLYGVSSVQVDENPEFYDYNACIHGVAIGTVDMCLGPFWVTPQRRTIVNFSPSIGSDTQVLLVKAGTDLMWYDRIIAPIMVFTPVTWGFLILTVLGSSVAQVYVERLSTSSANSGPLARSLSPLGRAWLESLYHYFNSLLTGSAGCRQPMMPRTGPGRILNIGFAMLMFVVVISYTANLGAHYTARATNSRLEGVEDYINAGYQICGYKTLEGDLFAKFPKLSSVWMGLEYSGDMPWKRSLDAGDCDAAIVGHSEVTCGQVMWGRLCDIEIMVSALEVQMAVPISSVPIGQVLMAATGQLSVNTVAANASVAVRVEKDFKDAGIKLEQCPGVSKDAWLKLAAWGGFHASAPAFNPHQQASAANSMSLGFYDVSGLFAAGLLGVVLTCIAALLDHLDAKHKASEGIMTAVDKVATGISESIRRTSMSRRSSMASSTSTISGLSHSLSLSRCASAESGPALSQRRSAPRASVSLPIIESGQPSPMRASNAV